MSDAHDRAAEAAETMAAAMREAIERETMWRKRAETAQSEADAALERERAAVQVARTRQLGLFAESAAATRALAVATLAAAIVARGIKTVSESVDLSRAALFGAEGGKP